jgi:3-oxoacyl-[acyl-carrier-protein] synthase I
LLNPQRLGATAQLLNGTLSPARALQWLGEVITAGQASYGIVAAVDGYLHRAALADLHARGRILNTVNSDGLVPGEAAGAILVSASHETPGELQCLGVGWGKEPATPGSGLPQRGEGLAAAVRGSFSAAGLATDGSAFALIDYRIADLSGEQHGFREAALALARTMRVRKAELDIWHPSESVGHVGAAAIPLAFGVGLAASRRAYAPGPGVLMHFGSDDGARAAIVLREFGRRSLPTLD